MRIVVRLKLGIWSALRGDDLHIFRAEITSYLEQLGLNDEDSLEDDELIIDDYEEF